MVFLFSTSYNPTQLQVTPNLLSQCPQNDPLSFTQSTNMEKIDKLSRNQT